LPILIQENSVLENQDIMDSLMVCLFLHLKGIFKDF
jgi:hypothetical protein